MRPWKITKNGDFWPKWPKIAYGIPIFEIFLYRRISKKPFVSRSLVSSPWYNYVPRPFTYAKSSKTWYLKLLPQNYAPSQFKGHGYPLGKFHAQTWNLPHFGDFSKNRQNGKIDHHKVRIAFMRFWRQNRLKAILAITVIDFYEKRSRDSHKLTTIRVKIRIYGGFWRQIAEFGDLTLTAVNFWGIQPWLDRSPCDDWVKIKIFKKGWNTPYGNRFFDQIAV